MISKFILGLNLIRINPCLFFKYLKKTIIETVFLKLLKFKIHQSAQKKIKGVIFSFNFRFSEKDLYIKQMYFGCYQIALVEAMKKILKPGDIFIDVGASIGYLTAIGASLVGKEGEVHSFEPVPEHFQILKNLSLINPDYKIIVRNYALGEKTGIGKMDCTVFVGGNTMISGFLTFHKVSKKKSIDVPVIRLDDYIKEKKLGKISLIKIDVEGFEFPVLKGLENYFKETTDRPIIICEITPSAYPLLGYTRNQLLEYMRKYGYEAYNIMNPKLKVDITKFKEGTDVIFKTQE